jgi:uncharacterized membrane protein
METFLLVVLLVALFIRWRVMSSRLEEMDQRIVDFGAERTDVSDLVRRINSLEGELRRMRMEPSLVPSSAAPTRVEAVLVPPPLPVVVVEEARKTVAPEPEVIVSTPPPPPLPISPPSLGPAIPTLGERVREQMAGEEWETIVGGNWLNKLGVFVLVIGVALFLGYSFTRVGPAGRAAIGVAVSLAMLAAGFVLERRAHYGIFARGLLGGGWAALYFSTYAMQAVDAAKVISSPLLGAALLMAVATGMILHALRYRSQTVTGLAYFIAFVTLAITPVTALSVVALVPLAASLLYVANRFEWSAMALFGLVATYGTCASRGDSGAPLWQAQTIFTTYWLLFEGFDLLRARRRAEYQRWDRAILPLNALAFVALSYAKWSQAAPGMLYALAAGIAAAYLASTILRALLRPPSSFTAETGTLERAFSGGFEGPITLTAILTAAAVFLKLQGVWVHGGLLAEAELLFLAGLLFRQAYPRQLAAALFSVGIGKLLIADIPGGGPVKHWTPVTGLAGLLFYINRALRIPDKAYGYAASGMFALILAFQAPERYLGLSWFAFAALLFAFGWLRRLDDFRIQGYCVAVLGFGATAVHQMNILSGLATVSQHRWMSLAGAAILSYAGVMCALRSAEDRLKDWERTLLRVAGSWTTTIVLVGLILRTASTQYVGLGWLSLAIPILELGLRGLPAEFRKQSYLVTIAGSIYVLLFNVLPIRTDADIVERLIPVGAALPAYLFAGRLFVARKDDHQVDLSSAIGSLFLLVALWALLPAAIVAPAWALVSMLLIEIGFGADIPSLRSQGHIAGAAAFGRLFFANFTGLGATAGVSHRLLTVVPVLLSHYYQWSRQRAGEKLLRDWERKLGRAYLYAAAILMVVLMRFELGRVLDVVGWAIFTLALSIAGQRWNNIDLRWQSYAVAALTFWRSWITNFDAPESLAGAAGRILTAAAVIACFFAAQLSIPQSNDRTGLERHARAFYSLLATLLLTTLLFHEVSGSVLTVAWGLEGVSLLIAGFPLRDRILRLSGLALFLVCILKLFFYDLRQLDTPYRILSFIALGVILMGVSWIYTRFRDQVKRYL